MFADPFRLAVIVGSTRQGRFGPTVARWFVARAEQRADMVVDVVDLADAALPLELTSSPEPAAAARLAAVTAALDTADAFVVVTPEYNHSFPAAVKNLVDWHHAQWRAKPVAFVCYGGMSGGLRAVEQLRQVFAELHAVTVRDTVSFHRVWERFDAGGNPVDAADCDAAAKTMLDQIAWWAHALRDARTDRPYVA